MKKLISLLLLLYVVATNLDAATLYTPNGKSFSTHDEGAPSYDAEFYASWSENVVGPGTIYPNTYVVGEWEDGIWEYNCHVFAWNNWQGAERWNSESDMWILGQPSPYNLMWRDFPDVWYTDSDNPIGIVSYLETTTESEASITTYKSGSTITHSARIVGDGNRYISKWGNGPIVNHPPTEVPSDYGDIYEYYKINPAHRPVGDGDLVGRDWGTIENALDGIPSGGVVSTSGIITQNNSITINNTITLYINPGTTIKFNGYRSMTIKAGGKILAEGTSSNRIIFTSATGTERESWGNIFVYSSNNRFSYCTFRYGNWALKVYGSPNRTSNNIVDNCTFRDNSQALRIEKVSNATVTNNRIYDNIHGLVCINNTSIWFEGNRIYNNGRDGVYSTSSNYLSFKYNVIENNGNGGTGTRNGIYTRNQDIIYLGKPYTWSWSGYNTIRYNYSHEIYASYGSPIVYMKGNSIHDDSDSDYEIKNTTSYYYPAWYCWFGYNGLQSYGNIDERYTLSSLPSWEGSTGPGGAFRSIASGGVDPGSPRDDDRNSIAEIKRLIMTNTSSTQALEALSELYTIVRPDYITDSYREAALFYPFLDRIMQNYSDQPIGQLALRYMIIWKMLENDNAAVIQLSNRALNILEDEDRMCVLQDLALTYIYTGQLGNARTVLNECREKYAFDKDMIEIIEESLEEAELAASGGFGARVSATQLTNVTSAPIPETFRLSQNYPNPFNPTTTISYELPEDSFTELRVYDLMGKEIRTLVNGNKNAGFKSIIWDSKDKNGRPVSSGMYFYSIDAVSTENDKQFHETKKMVLLR